MSLTIWSASQATEVTTAAHLGRLVTRISVDDRLAFRHLYAFLAMSVWCSAVRELPNPHDAAAVTRSTFVEVWYLAQYRRNDGCDTRAWLAAITTGRANDRTRIRAETGTGVDVYDAHVRRELRRLLGPGHALIRTAPRTFMNVDDLDHALTAIAATVGWK